MSSCDGASPHRLRLFRFTPALLEEEEEEEEREDFLPIMPVVYWLLAAEVGETSAVRLLLLPACGSDRRYFRLVKQVYTSDTSNTLAINLVVVVCMVDPAYSHHRHRHENPTETRLQ